MSEPKIRRALNLQVSGAGSEADPLETGPQRLHVMSISRGAAIRALKHPRRYRH